MERHQALLESNDKFVDGSYFLMSEGKHIATIYDHGNAREILGLWNSDYVPGMDQRREEFRHDHAAAREPSGLARVLHGHRHGRAPAGELHRQPRRRHPGGGQPHCGHGLQRHAVGPAQLRRGRLRAGVRRRECWSGSAGRA